MDMDLNMVDLNMELLTDLHMDLNTEDLKKDIKDIKDTKDLKEKDSKESGSINSN